MNAPGGAPRAGSIARRLPGALSILLLVALPAARGRAENPGPIDPFAGLDAIRLSTAVGGPLDLEGGTAPELFAGDLRRFNHFQLDLANALAVKLGSCGILVDPGAPDELSVELFGRLQELEGCTPRYVYMIQAKVRNSKHRDREAADGFVLLRPVIGLADEAGLEKALIEAAVAAIAGELRNCGG